ncbi:hypothetical protein E2562_033831 [Oryza meyeriana var. granulata]|uniref:Uncharacterized protein n=1 Tax=Oryza meyeriana var. granulata TaxID=110450 RepID=A0A6G1F191_9ORYZ|nr:hypothetical protein E2562_033831 [Oryza meyeriana var. granulata]
MVGIIPMSTTRTPYLYLAATVCHYIEMVEGDARVVKERPDTPSFVAYCTFNRLLSEATLIGSNIPSVGSGMDEMILNVFYATIRSPPFHCCRSRYKRQLHLSSVLLPSASRSSPSPSVLPITIPLVPSPACIPIALNQH